MRFGHRLGIFPTLLCSLSKGHPSTHLFPANVLEPSSDILYCDRGAALDQSALAPV